MLLRRCVTGGWLCTLLATQTCMSGAAAERLPVVFVPGTAGSQLSAPQADGTTKPLWLSMRLIDPPPGGIDLAALGPDGQDGSTRLVADGLLNDLRLRVRLDLRSTFELLDAGGTPIESRSNLPLYAVNLFVDLQKKS